MVNEDPISQPAEERFRAVLEQSPYSIQIMSPDGRTLRVNRAWEELWGVKLEQIAGYNMLEDQQLVERGIMPLIRRAFEGEAVELPLILYDPEETVPGATRHRDARRWTKAVAYPIKDAAGRVLEVVLMHEDVTARVLAEEENARLAAEAEARRQRQEADDRFLAEATTALASSLDYETTLSTLARLAVPHFADWCGVDIADEGGTLRRLAVAHVDPAKVAWALELQQRYPPDPAAPRGSYQVLRTGESEFYPEITDEMLVAAAHDEEHLAALRAMEFRSAMIVPLKTRDRVLGIIVFVNTESGSAARAGRPRLRRRPRGPRGARRRERAALPRRAADAQGRRADVRPPRPASGHLLRALAGAHAAAGRRRRHRAGHQLARRARGHRRRARRRRHELRPRHHRRLPAEVVEGWKRFTLETPVPLADAARERLPVLVESFANYSERYPMLGPLASVTGSRALVALPLIVKGRTIGAIGLSFPAVQTFTEDDRAFMLALAQQCAQALERARLYETEQRLRAEAEAANRLKDEFLATVSHELRTPLTAIVGWSNMLRANVLDEESKARAVEIIERNAKAQTQIVEDLLDVSRIITGKLTLDTRAAELASVVEAALESVRPAAAKKGLTIRSEVEPGVGAVWGDPARLEQVMWNLLANAVKFTPAGGEVSVRLSRAGRRVRVAVADTGQGIAPEFLPFVFHRFRQADGSTTRAHGGLGLGLAIVRQLVEMHGGTVNAESAGAGRGATFTVELPVMAAGPVGSGTCRRTRPPPATPADDGASAAALDPATTLADLRVLLVDDEPDARLLLTTVLEQRGAHVLAVASAPQALAALAAFRPDIIVSDIGMPGEDGYSLLRKVRSLAPADGGRVPAVALTAYAREEDRMRALRAGYQVHVAKPVNPAEFVAVVGALAGVTARK